MWIEYWEQLEDYKRAKAAVEATYGPADGGKGEKEEEEKEKG